MHVIFQFLKNSFKNWIVKVLPMAKAQGEMTLWGSLKQKVLRYSGWVQSSCRGLGMGAVSSG